MAAGDPNEGLYSVVYRAVNDALWNVINTVVETLVLVVVFLWGLSVLIPTLMAAGSPISILVVLLAGALVVFSIGAFLKLFNLLPQS